MRKLQSRDIFSAARLISEIGIKDDFIALAEKAKTTGKIDAGYDLLFVILERVTTSKAEKSFYEFLAGILETEPEEVAQMDPCLLMDKLLEVADVENWRNFFSHLRSLMKRN